MTQRASHRIVAVGVTGCDVLREAELTEIGLAWVRSKGHGVEIQLDLSRAQSKVLVLRMVSPGDGIEE